MLFKNTGFRLIVANLLAVFFVLLPFMPGRYDKLAFVISGVIQLNAVLGIIFVPVGFLWLRQELRKRYHGHVMNDDWSNGFYYAVTAGAVGLCLLICLGVAVYFVIGLSGAVLVIVAIFFLTPHLLTSIRSVRDISGDFFHTAPLYLITVPLVVLATRLFLLAPASNYSRNYAMNHATSVIAAIENYRDRTGSYPESIEYLHDIANPSVMGIPGFVYERNSDAYNLSFVQWQHFGATREVVMYNKNDRQNVKGHFESYSAGRTHWKYYWLD